MVTFNRTQLLCTESAEVYLGLKVLVPVRTKVLTIPAWNSHSLDLMAVDDAPNIPLQVPHSWSPYSRLHTQSPRSVFPNSVSVTLDILAAAVSKSVPSSSWPYHWPILTADTRSAYAHDLYSQPLWESEYPQHRRFGWWVHGSVSESLPWEPYIDI